MEAAADQVWTDEVNPSQFTAKKDHTHGKLSNLAQIYTPATVHKQFDLKKQRKWLEPGGKCSFKRSFKR